MLLDSILESGTPYQAECGVSKVVYLPCGRHSLLADKRNEASHVCVIITGMEPPEKEMIR